MAQPAYSRPVQSRPRAVHLVLRDGDTVDGGIYLTDGQALAPYLGSRKNGWVNIVDATWGLEGELHKHAVLQTEHIVMASASRGDYPVVASTQNGVPRAVDILLEDGTRLQGNLLLGSKQRLSDYLAGTGTFIALLEASRVQDGTAIGDVAVNSACVKAVRDSKIFSAEPAVAQAASEDWGGIRRGASVTPVQRERVPRVSGAIEVVTPAHPEDRRRPSVVGSEADRLTPEQAKRAAVAERHWLSQLASEARLQPADARDLTGAVSLDEIWRSIATRNDMADAEISVMIATAYKLELADFDQVTPAAIKCVPEKVARRLGVLPVLIDGRTLVVAVSDPESLDIEQQLGFVTRHALKRAIATPADIAGAIDWYYRDPSMTA